MGFFENYSNILDFGLNGLLSLTTRGLFRELFIELRSAFISLMSSEVSVGEDWEPAEGEGLVGVAGAGVEEGVEEDPP